MGNEKYHFIKIAVVSSITIGIELFLNIWSCIQIENLGVSNVEVTQKAKEVVVTFLLLIFGSYITFAIGIFFQKILLLKSYKEFCDERYRLAAFIFSVLKFGLLSANSLGGVLGGYLLLNDAGISLFEMIGMMY